MATVTTAQIQQIYIGYLGRAADQEGLNYWVEQITNDVLTLEQLRANITNEQQEYTEGYGQMERADLVEAVYQSLFERSADAEGLTYWTEGEGKDINDDQLILAILSGASEADQTILDNKTEVAEYYTAQMGENYDAESAKSSIDSVDATEESVTAAKSSVDSAMNPGSTFTLTSDPDPVNGTSGNDVITAAAGTLNSADLISDASSTDSDTLNIVFSAADIAAAPTATVSGIENINVSIDAFAGTANTLNATNIKGSTITLSSSKLGYDGAAGVSNLDTNNVTAGANVTALTVAGADTGAVVNTGSATTVTVDAEAASDALDLVVNGNITADLGNTTAFNSAAITATTDSNITLASGTDITGTTEIKGSGNVTLTAAAAELTGKTITNTGTGTLTVSVTDNNDADLDDIASTAVSVVGGYSSNLTLATDTMVSVAGDLGTATIAVAGTDAAEAVTVDVTGDTVGVVDITGVETTTFNVNQDTTIGALTATDQDVKVTGAFDVISTSAATATAADSFDASALEGKLTYTTTTGTTQTVKGGTLANTLTTSTDDITTYVGQDGGDTINANTTTGTLSVETGSGKDTVKVTALTAGGKVVGTLGAGDDTVEFSSDISTGQVTIDAGEGTADVISLADGADLGTAATTSSLTGFEKIVFATTGGTSAEVGAFVVSGQTLAVEGTANTDSLTVTGKAATADTIDLSGLTFDAVKTVETVAIEGGSGNDVITGVVGIATETIKGGAGNDTINAGVGIGNDTITGGAGNDTINLTGASGINTLVLEGATNGKDTINGWGAVDVLNVETSGSGDINAEAADAVGLQAAFTDETAVILNTNGTAANLTTSGTATVADWADLTDVAAYLSERYTGAANDDGMFIINDTTAGANTTYVFNYVEDGNATTIEAGELELIGVIDNGGAALSVANVDYS